MVWGTNIVINCIMKNNNHQILSEIRSLMASIKSQVEELEIKIAEYEQSVDFQDVPEDCERKEADVEIVETELVADLDDDVMDIELETSDDLPFYDDLPVSEPDIEPQSEAQPEAQHEPQPEPQPERQTEPEVEDFPLPVIDAMTAKQPWRTDMPGSPVRDIRSAISLNDRILFINYLFNEDPMAFQEMLIQLNAMASFDEAAAYAIAVHPEWNLESDTVYRFMMALRRRHQ